MLRIGSLFSGIGGLDLGIESALRDGGFDCETTWQCEADAWCRGVLARHWPDAIRHDDVRTIGPIPYASWAESVDILEGGFPCQDLSFAGKGAGLAGERSGLWFEFVRIIRELRPRIVVVENVAALAVRGLDVVLGTLSEAGYDALWFDLRASDVGAPHRRERLFIVAWRRDVGDGAGSRREGSAGGYGAGTRRVSGVAGGAGDVADPNGGRREQQRECSVLDDGRTALGHDADGRDGESAGVGLADPCGAGLQGHGHVTVGVRAQHAGARGVRGRVAESGVGRAVDGLPCGVDITAHRWPVGPGEAQPEGEPPRITQDRTQRRQRLKALGNAVVPQQSYVVGCVVVEILMTMRAA